MNGKEILVDTNIFLYLLKGNDTLEEMLQGKKIYVSFMTELGSVPFITYYFIKYVKEPSVKTGGFFSFDWVPLAQF